MSSKAEVTGRIVELMQLVIASSVMTNERIARSLGLNVVDIQALGFIARSGAPLTAGEVSQQTELPTSTTTRVLDRLEKHGLIERSTDPNDRRRVVVQARTTRSPDAGPRRSGRPVCRHPRGHAPPARGLHRRRARGRRPLPRRDQGPALSGRRPAVIRTDPNYAWRCGTPETPAHEPRRRPEPRHARPLRQPRQGGSPRRPRAEVPRPPPTGWPARGCAPCRWRSPRSRSARGRASSPSPTARGIRPARCSRSSSRSRCRSP